MPVRAALRTGSPRELNALLSILREAGWPIWPLLATSVLGLALIFERFLSLRRGLVMPRGLSDQVAEMLRNRQDTPDAINRLERNSPLGRILAEVMRHRHLPREELRNVSRTPAAPWPTTSAATSPPSAPSPWSRP